MSAPPSRRYIQRAGLRLMEPIYELYAAVAKKGGTMPSRDIVRFKFGVSREVIMEAERLLLEAGRIFIEVHGARRRVGITATNEWTLWAPSNKAPVTKTQLRKCLKCGKLFPSRGPGNRICCNRTGEGIDVLGQPSLYS